MANADIANGFTHIGGPSTMHEYTSSAAIAVGDLVSIASGKIAPYSEGDGDPFVTAIGVAATSATGSGTTVLVYDSPTAVFRVQTETATAYVAATHDGKCFDVAGATGVQECNLGATVNDTLIVLGQELVNGSTEEAAHAKVRVMISRHALGAYSANTSRSSAADPVAN